MSLTQFTLPTTNENMACLPWANIQFQKRFVAYASERVGYMDIVFFNEEDATLFALRWVKE